MSAADSAGEPEFTDFCRRARRIRARHASAARVQAELRRLSEKDTSPEPAVVALPISAGRFDWSKSAVLGHRTSAARDFADLVALRLVGTVLPWSQRQLLLEEASSRGIERFEANLIIAAVQHHLQPVEFEAQISFTPATLLTYAAPERKMQFSRIATMCLLFLAFEAALGLAVWRLFL